MIGGGPVCRFGGLPLRREMLAQGFEQGETTQCLTLLGAEFRKGACPGAVPVQVSFTEMSIESLEELQLGLCNPAVVDL